MATNQDAIDSALDRVDLLAYRVEYLIVLLCLQLRRLSGTGTALAVLEELRQATEAHSVASDEVIRLHKTAPNPQAGER